jgi:hypothetical protein
VNDAGGKERHDLSAMLLTAAADPNRPIEREEQVELQRDEFG